MIKSKIFIKSLLLFSSLLSFSSCKRASQNYVQKYVDLHFHLDGSITVDIARKLAALQNISLPEDDSELEKLLTLPADCESLNDFLKCFALPCSLMQTPEAIKESVYLIAENIKKQGVIYAEFRWAPQNHTLKGMSQEEAVLAALDGLKKTDLKVNLILCFMRGQGNEKANEETLELAKKYLVKDGGVVAVDLAGAEALFPTKNYREIFAKAKEYGIPFTIHAGEADGAESVRAALDYGAKRIGHGVRSFEDPALLERIKNEAIVLEMCPTSNRQTAAVKNMDEYPFMDYLKRGIKVTINTDDMAIEGTNIAKEFRYMEEKFGLTLAQEKIILTNAVEAAFTSDQVKNQLKKELGL